MPKIRVFVVDDHAVLRAGLRLLIEAQADMCVVGEIDNGQEVVVQAKKCQPDVIIMDLSLPGLGGVAATQAIKQALPTTYVLALTRHKNPGYLHRLLDAGATGYVLKKTMADELINAIRHVAAGSIYIDPHLTNQVNVLWNKNPQILAPLKVVHPSQFNPNKISTRETEVLRLIAWGYSNKEIAVQLNISVKTVEFHKANATEKLHLNSRTDIIHYALANGWLQIDEDPE